MRAQHLRLRQAIGRADWKSRHKVECRGPRQFEVYDLVWSKDLPNSEGAAGMPVALIRHAMPEDGIVCLDNGLYKVRGRRAGCETAAPLWLPHMQGSPPPACSMAHVQIELTYGAAAWCMPHT